MIRRKADIIDVNGYNGDFCRISPPGFSWGPELAPHSMGLYDPTPIQSNWVPYGFGQSFQSWKPKRRTLVWTINVANPYGPGNLTEDADLWHTIYSRWSAMFSPQFESTITYTSTDGARSLGVRTIEAPKPFSTYNFEGKDPGLFAFGSVVQTMGCELPFYVGNPFTDSWEFGAGDFSQTIPFFNPASVDCWPEWGTTGAAQYRLPDFSYGSEAYGRGVADAGKTILLVPQIDGEDLDIQTRPDLETFITALETPFGMRMGGRDFEYPIPAGMGDSAAGAVISGSSDGGARVQLTLPRWYDEPFSTARVV